MIWDPDAGKFQPEEYIGTAQYELHYSDPSITDDVGDIDLDAAYVFEFYDSLEEAKAAAPAGVHFHVYVYYATETAVQGNRYIRWELGTEAGPVFEGTK